ncbi:uncharacterized protein BDCG_03106 [Blastomyces dermatitidis ER-3]|uniref:Uncharacterized protein n=2 Tax=Ajellomyces dermatitidis TaxID=5039 RepID=F2TBA0_AJEDA|nr:uncharacterized protein BDCG_03106 [Blastomyces dermatitidis ER-3]EEQ87986.1 hypothetical protein BDCG_03106 [Blastomyces dermatitidis ER-3]EGE80487.1 hypothetical protein BDDG_03428 [Blastomyces dermatitidis ATCC 18188]EQL27985.1 hypothetical protein BDFG_09224 [Blastomyces dermatitidis ATCC 26199]
MRADAYLNYRMYSGYRQKGNLLLSIIPLQDYEQNIVRYPARVWIAQRSVTNWREFEKRIEWHSVQSSRAVKGLMTAAQFPVPLSRPRTPPPDITTGSPGLGALAIPLNIARMWL